MPSDARAVRLFVFADPQGNPWAVEALLDRAKRRKATEVVCLGSAVGAGPEPQRTVELLRKRHVVLVRGLHDDAALGRLPGPTTPPEVQAQGDANARRLASADLAYLRGASPPRRITLGGRTFLLTSEPEDASPTLDVLVQPGAATRVAPDQRVVRIGSAAAPTGEAPYLFVDDEEGGGELRVDHAAWDVDALLRAAARAEAGSRSRPRTS